MRGECEDNMFDIYLNGQIVTSASNLSILFNKLHRLITAYFTGTQKHQMLLNLREQLRKTNEHDADIQSITIEDYTLYAKRTV